MNAQCIVNIFVQLSAVQCVSDLPSWNVFTLLYLLFLMLANLFLSFI